MPQHDIVEAETITQKTKKFPLAMPKSKAAYGIYAAGGLLLVAGVAAAIFGASKADDSTDIVASDNETPSN